MERSLLLARRTGAVGRDGHRLAMHAFSLTLLLVVSAVYAAGVRRLWARAGRRGISIGHVSAFGAGMLVLALAIVSPLHHVAERLLWAHMVQHELLMVISAPLFVLGRPLETWMWGLPRGWRGCASRPWRAMGPVSAWTLHAAALWLW